MALCPYLGAPVIHLQICTGLEINQTEDLGKADASPIYLAGRTDHGYPREDGALQQVRRAGLDKPCRDATDQWNGLRNIFALS
jgi:hypothetical protein